MGTEFTASIYLPTEDATSAFGACIAPVLKRGDVVLLSGQIGAGKTHLARAIIQTRLAAQGLSEDVPSPTYTLVQTYSDGLVEIWHADLYRLSDTSELTELGLDDAYATCVVLIEWPDRLGEDVPEGALLVELVPENGARRVSLSSDSDRWQSLTPCLEAAENG